MARQHYTVVSFESGYIVTRRVLGGDDHIVEVRKPKETLEDYMKENPELFTTND